jgi:hypothetical protein
MKISRRSFLKKTLATGTLLAGAGTFFPGCSGIRRSDLKEPNSVNHSILYLDAARQTILQYASLAPSGHNSQPWYVKIESPNQWVIGLDPNRRLPAVDPNNREAMLSIGAFAENLFIAAGTFGLQAEMNVIATEMQDREERDILRISLTRVSPVDYPLQRISERRTVKNGFISDEIKTEDVNALSKSLDGNLHYFPSGTAHADCIQEGAIENFRIQAQRNDAQRELVQWLRLRDEDARRYRDGLTVEGMEIQGIKGWYVRNFVKPKDFMKPSFRQQGVDHTAALARQGGGWFVITSQGQSPADLIDTGRRFERMALLARERNIAIHPMTQFLEEENGLNQIAAHHQTSMIPQFLLRVGYLKKYPEPVTLRRPVGWFVRIS